MLIEIFLSYQQQWNPPVLNKGKAGVCLDPAARIKIVSGMERGWEGGIMPFKWYPKWENYWKSCIFNHIEDWKKHFFFMDLHCKTRIRKMLFHFKSYSSALLTSFCRHCSIVMPDGSGFNIKSQGSKEDGVVSQSKAIWTSSIDVQI